MNRRTCVLLLATATLAACGQPPSPGTPRAVPQAEATTTTTVVTTTTTTVVTPPPTTTTTPPPKPPPRTTTTTKPPPPPPPPPPPKPPDRWVLPSGLRGSIEEQDNQAFPGAWEGIKGQVKEVCPGKVPCVGYTLVVDSSTGESQDCYIVDGGIKVPDPLYEGGKITFKVTNTLCPQG